MKSLKILVTTIIVLVIIYLVCSQFGIFSIYRSPTLANEPAIQMNDIIFSTNLKEYKSGDFIIYKRDKNKFIHRLVAQGGDTLKIIDGKVYVNNNDFDKNLTLIHTYKVNIEDVDKFQEKATSSISTFVRQISKEDVLILAEDNLIKRLDISATKIVEDKNKKEEFIKKVWGDYNKDFFGPVIIPANMIFVLGDNRDWSEDSRYLGLIINNDICSVILNK